MICQDHDQPGLRCPAFDACMARMRRSYREQRFLPFVLPSCNAPTGEDPVAILVRYWIMAQPAGTEFVSSQCFAAVHDGRRTLKHFVRMGRLALQQLRREA